MRPRHGAPADRLTALVALGAEACDRMIPGERLDPLAESDREQELAELLDRRMLADGPELASVLAEARLGPEWVDRVATGVGEDGLDAQPPLRRGLCRHPRVVLGELEEATTRISDLVGAVRNYSYLDQAPSRRWTSTRGSRAR